MTTTETIQEIYERMFGLTDAPGGDKRDCWSLTIAVAKTPYETEVAPIPHMLESDMIILLSRCVMPKIKSWIQHGDYIYYYTTGDVYDGRFVRIDLYRRVDAKSRFITHDLLKNLCRMCLNRDSIAAEVICMTSDMRDRDNIIKSDGTVVIKMPYTDYEVMHESLRVGGVDNFKFNEYGVAIKDISAHDLSALSVVITRNKKIKYILLNSMKNIFLLQRRGRSFFL